MTRLPRAFMETDVALDTTLQTIERMLTSEGALRQRYMNESPPDAERRGDLGRGRLVYEFDWPDGPRDLTVSVSVTYHPKDEGTTAAIAARALLWLIQSRLESVDWGIETFGSAFMAHIIGADTQNYAMRQGPVIRDVPIAAITAPEDSDATTNDD